jgi:GMP synthase (glutamine-hydrolysing)
MSFQSRKISAESLLNFRRGPQAAAPSTADSLLPVLIVLHQETSTPGRVGNVLRALGHRLDVRRPRFGDPLPETLDGHAGAVIFGGPMSVNDPDDFIRREIDWIAVPLREQRPFLGICLGAQMLAVQLRARCAASARPVADRILSGTPDARRARDLSELAGSRLPLASGGI